MKQSLWITMMVSLPLALACSAKNFQLPTQAASFQQVPNFNNKVDMLFVSDDSSSMLAYRQGMGAQAQNMINTLNQMGMDYHIAVTTTSVGAGYMGGKFVSGSYVTNSTPNVATVLAQNLAFTAPGSDLEQGMMSMELALSPANLALSGSSGFLRSGALLAVIFVSDDDDYSTGQPADYLTFLNSIKTPFANGAPSFVANYIGTLALDAACGSFVNVGTRYMSLSASTSGLQASVCDPNWSEILGDVQILIGQLLTNYYLSVQPNPASIVVTVNGATIPNNAANGWTLQTSTISGKTSYYIQFNGSAIPTLYSTVNVSFTPASAN